MTDLNDFREHYEHDEECTPEMLTEVNPLTGFRGCFGCSGVFYQDGVTGVAKTHTNFDPDRPRQDPPTENEA